MFKAEGVSCLAHVGLLNLKSSATLAQEQRLSVIIPHEMGGQKRLLVTRFDVRLDDVTNPISQQTDQIQQRIKESQLSLQSVNERSERYKDFVDGIVLRDSDVQLRGEWRVEKLLADTIVVDGIDDSTVTFNQDIWTEGLDVVVEGLQRQMAQLAELVDSMAEALRSKKINNFLFLPHVWCNDTSETFGRFIAKNHRGSVSFYDLASYARLFQSTHDKLI